MHSRQSQYLLQWKLFVVFSIGLFLSVQGLAQNLVTNPSFEDLTTCPPGISGGPLTCVGWISPTLGTSDYFHECNVTGVGVPNNFVGSQDAHTGDAYGGGYYYFGNLGDYREYLQTQLTEPLTTGVTYDVSLWYSLGDNAGFDCPMNQLGIYLSVVAPSAPGSTTPLNVVPQVQFANGFISNTTSWQQLSGCFVASGGEEYITIGNFYPDAQTEADPSCSAGGFTYLYIDDVSVIENGSMAGTIAVDLGPDLEECDSVILDPGLGGVSFTWQDGSHEPTLTATETGTYYLTVTSGCDIGIDSVDVVIIPSAPPVDLGPAEMPICDNAEIEINLDPALGDYTWQDNSTGANYTITTPGIYAVTLDDGCDVTMDQIEVFLVDPPQPFSLGNDTTLCTGESLTLSLDPALGDFTWQDMSTDPEFEITTSGLYSLTISNMCGSFTNTITVDFLDDPMIDFPDDVIIACPGDVIELAFDPALGDYIWQDGTTGPVYEVTEEGEYSVSVMNLCGSDFAEIYVDFLSEPQLELGEDIILCPPQLPYLLDISDVDDADNIVWQDGSAEIVYEVVQSGIYTVIISNACFSVQDAIEIIVEDEAPQIALPDDLTLCPGQTFLLDVGNIPGDYEWQDGSTDPVYEITTAGTYAVTVSNLCGVGTDAITVEYNLPIADLDLGGDISLCPGDEVLLQANIPDVSFFWQDGSMTNAFLVDTSGTFILIISNLCEAHSDTVIAILDGSPPALNLVDSISVCEGDSIEIDPGIGGVSFIWSTGETTPTIFVNAPVDIASYTLTVTNSCGEATDVVVITNAGASPSVDLGADITLCPGEIVSIPANAVNGEVLWYDGSMGDTLNVSAPGLVSVQVSSGCGVAFDTLNVSVLNATPVLELGADTILCPGEVLLLEPGVANVDYLWHDGSLNTAFTVSAPGLVSLQIADACGSSHDSIFIDYYPDVPVFTLGPDASLCPGELITLNPGISDVTYLWHDGSNSSSFTVTEAGLVHVTLQSNCWQISDTIEIIEDASGPMIDLGSDTTVCEGETLLLEAGTPGVDYLWHDGSTGSSFLTTTTQQIILQVSNACGIDADTIFVMVAGTIPDVELGEDTILCEGTSLVLVPEISGAVTYLWHDGSGNASFTVNEPGLYSLQASNICGIASDSILITAGFIPQDFSLGDDVIICAGEIVTLNAPLTSDALLWQDGSANTSFIANGPGLYSLQIVNACGIASDTIQISVLPAPQDFSLGADLVVCPGETVILTAPTTSDALQWSDGSTSETLITSSGIIWLNITNGCGTAQDSISIGINQDILVTDIDTLYQICDGEFISLDVTQTFDAQYLWSTGAITPDLQLTESGIYIVTITSECDVMETSTEIETEDCDPLNVYVPNIFSPNGDNINDLLLVLTNFPERIADFQFAVFDRWGNIIFYSQEINTGWDGSFRDSPMNPGVYIYMVRWRDMDGAPIVVIEHGDITLIR